jgi:hypothetical protein|eukprot:COSAG03_NODE_5313_length_1278_cov_0.996607_1_plen_101_part_00
MEALNELRQRHAAFVKKVHSTKLILHGNRLRAVQVFYVVGTFTVCLGALKWATPDQEALKANLPRARHTGNRPPGIEALQDALGAAKRAKEEAEAAKASR